VGPSDRRSVGRPWWETSPGRRREDGRVVALRREVAEAQKALSDAEALLEAAEGGLPPAA
jgi:hypothetical protein